MTARTIALEWWLDSKSQIKIRSILILSHLKDCRYDKEEYPVPKSSIAIRTPSDLRRRRIDTAREKSLIITLSVISSSRRPGARPVSSKIEWTSLGRSPWRNCIGETLTAMVSGCGQDVAS